MISFPSWCEISTPSSNSTGSFPTRSRNPESGAPIRQPGVRAGVMTLTRWPRVASSSATPRPAGPPSRSTTTTWPRAAGGVHSASLAPIGTSGSVRRGQWERQRQLFGTHRDEHDVDALEVDSSGVRAEPDLDPRIGEPPLENPLEATQRGGVSWRRARDRATPPRTSADSHSTTRWPSAAPSIAALMPATPPPATSSDRARTTARTAARQMPTPSPLRGSQCMTESATRPLG